MLAAERLFAPGQHFALKLHRALEMSTRAFQHRQILQALQAAPVRRTKSPGSGGMDVAERRLRFAEARHGPVGLAEVGGRFECFIGFGTVPIAQPRQGRFEHPRRDFGMPLTQRKVRARRGEVERGGRVRAMHGGDIRRQRGIRILRLRAVPVVDVVVDQCAAQGKRMLTARAAQRQRQLECARELTSRLDAIADAHVPATEDGADRRFFRRSPGEAHADGRARAAEHIVHAQIGWVGGVEIRRGKQIVVEKAVDLAANSNIASGIAPGECAAGEPLPVVDTIAFAIAGGGVHTIAATGQMPQIT